jgi:hypothetical protein
LDPQSRAWSYLAFKKTPLHDWASHGADAFRYLSLAWREPMPSDVEPNALELLRQEAMKPKTMDDIWRKYIEERIANGEELDDDAHSFNLSNTMEMKWTTTDGKARSCSGLIQRNTVSWGQSMQESATYSYTRAKYGRHRRANVKASKMRRNCETPNKKIPLCVRAA